MSEDLYQKALIDLAKAGDAVGRLDHADVSVTVDNPLCGDRITLDLDLADDHIHAVGHKVRGCLLCRAAAAVLASNAVGASMSDVRGAAEAARALLKGEPLAGGAWPDLAAFAPVRGYKSRHDCVMLPFEAAIKALSETD